MNLASINVRFGAETSGFTSGIGAMQSAMRGFSGGASALLAGVGIAISALAVKMGIDAVKAAGDFQQQMIASSALAGVATKDISGLSAAIMQMAVASGQSPQNLAKGLYYIASAGFSAKDAMVLLNLSAKSAASGMTDTQTVADALTTVMKAFNIPISQASKTMDIMTQTVATGKTEWADYAKVIGIVAVNASRAHISFNEASAAFAELTNVMHGSKMAKDALDALLQTSSRFDILAMRAKAMGLAFDETHYKTLNLAGRLEYLKQITGGNEQEMTNLLGRQNAVAAATVLLTNHMTDYQSALQKITNSSGATAEAFKKTQQGFNQQSAQLSAAFDVLKITLGSALLPLLNQFMQAVMPLVIKFADWETKTHGIEKALATAGGVINSVVGYVKGLLAPTGQLTGAWQTMQPILAAVGNFLVSTFAPAWKSLQDTIKAVAPLWAQLVAAIGPALPALKLLGTILGGVVVVGLMLFAKTLGMLAQGAVIAFGLVAAGVAIVVTAFLKFLASATTVVNTVKAVWNGIPGFFSGLWAGIVGIFSGAIKTVVGWFQWLYDHNTYFHQLADTIRSVVGSVVSWLTTAWHNVATTLAGVWETIKTKATDLWNTIGTIFKNAYSSHISGPLSGLAKSIGDWASSLATSAFTWGKNVIQGIIDGINAMLAAVKTAAGNIASAIASALGFHSPPPWGPASDSDQWAPNFVKMFTRGLRAGIPDVRAAFGELLSGVGYPSGGLNLGISGSFSGPHGVPAFGGGGGVTIVQNHIHVHPHIDVDGRELMERLGPHLADSVRFQTGNRRPV